MQRLTEDRFRERFGAADFLAACRRAFELYGRGEILNPPREETVEERDGMGYFHLDMPAEWPGHYRARKVIEEQSDVREGRLARREAYISLQDLRSGDEVRLDAGYITDMRTGAAGALAVGYLSASPPARVALVGTGRIARSLALACARLFDLQELRCTSRRQQSRRDFAAAVDGQLGAARLTMTDGLAACLEGADAVLTAVPTPEPVLRVADLRHVPVVGVIAGDSRTRQVDADLLESRQVVVDLLPQAERSGEFRWAREQGRLDAIALARDGHGRVLDLGAAACGRLERTGGVAYLTGMGAQDLCAAAMIVEGLQQDAATAEGSSS